MPRLFAPVADSVLSSACSGLLLMEHSFSSKINNSYKLLLLNALLLPSGTQTEATALIFGQENFLNAEYCRFRRD